MRISLYLMGNRTIRLDVEPDEWIAAFEQAMRENTVVKVKDPTDGGTLGVNPRTVLYWKVEPDSSGN